LIVPHRLQALASPTSGVLWGSRGHEKEASGMTAGKLLVIEPELESETVNAASDRSVGLVFAAVFTLIGAWPLLRWEAPRWSLLAIAAGFALVAVFAPRLLRPLNRVWFRIGLLLHRIVSPLVMGAVFFLCVTPIALIMRLRGKDLLALRREPARASYWILRDPPGPAPDSMEHQF
jgi:hypothetical protein